MQGQNFACYIEGRGVELCVMFRSQPAAGATCFTMERRSAGNLLPYAPHCSRNQADSKLTTETVELLQCYHQIRGGNIYKFLTLNESIFDDLFQKHVRFHGKLPSRSLFLSLIFLETKN
jgi:hypothetical protein